MKYKIRYASELFYNAIKTEEEKLIIPIKPKKP